MHPPPRRVECKVGTDGTICKPTDSRTGSAHPSKAVGPKAITATTFVVRSIRTPWPAGLGDALLLECWAVCSKSELRYGGKRSKLEE